MNFEHLTVLQLVLSLLTGLGKRFIQGVFLGVN